MSRNEKQIAIYSRKSRFTGKGESIGNQVELCKEYIRLHYGEKEAENAVIYEDEGFSGGNLNRPDFQRMLEAARQKKISTIIVYRLDRISRNIGDFAGLIEELGRMEISFVSIREQFDTQTPMGRAMMYIASVFSQLERETIAERIRDNMLELAKTGRWLGGTTPTGYGSESIASVTVDGKAKKACRLKLIPEEAEIVRSIFEIFQATDSLTATDAELLRRNMKSKTGKQFTRFTIKGILQNPVYMIADQDAWDYFLQQGVEVYASLDEFDGEHGIIAYNRTEQEKGKTTKQIPMQEWILCVGQHEGLIPGKTWVAVQQSLERNKSKAFRKPRSNEALLTGILYCSCGGRMYPKLNSRRNTAEGEPVYTYVCKIKERSQRAQCQGKNISGNLLDAAVIEEIKKLNEDQSTFLQQLEQSKKFYTGDREPYDNRLADLKAEREAQQTQIDGLVDSLAYLPGGAAKQKVAERIEQRMAQIQSLDQRIQELEGLTFRQNMTDSEFDLLRDMLSTFSGTVDLMTLEQKRSAVRALVRKVVWDGRNVHMILFGASEEDVEIPPLPLGVQTENAEEETCFDEEPQNASLEPGTRWGEDSK